MAKIKRWCEECNVGFEADSWVVKAGNGKYCSRKCHDNAMKLRITKSCEFCEATFEARQYAVKTGKGRFCSKECWNKHRTKKVKRNCLVCGKLFSIPPSKVKDGRGKYCSRVCLAQALQNQIECTCETCGTKFSVRASEPDRGGARFCSQDCWRQVITKRSYKLCEYCGSEFLARACDIAKGWSRFCCKQCYSEWTSENIIGEKTSNWQGGKSFEPYPPTFNKDFKRKIRQRDDYTCVICERKGRTVHHINYIKEDTNPENCITLCSSCHSKTNGNRDYWQSLLESIMINRDISPHDQARARLELDAWDAWHQGRDGDVVGDLEGLPLFEGVG